jgi:flavin reductase (DIM6/NTAB) family NADH-FMN oxidoreductase RutF
MVIGRVVGVHIDDDALTADGRLDVLKIRPIARLGYMDYTSVESVFSMPKPTLEDNIGARDAAE